MLKQETVGLLCLRMAKLCTQHFHKAEIIAIKKTGQQLAFLEAKLIAHKPDQSK